MEQAQARSRAQAPSGRRQTFAQLVLTKQAIFVGHPLLLQNKMELVIEFLVFKRILCASGLWRAC